MVKEYEDSFLAVTRVTTIDTINLLMTEVVNSTDSFCYKLNSDFLPILIGKRNHYGYYTAFKDYENGELVRYGSVDTSVKLASTSDIKKDIFFERKYDENGWLVSNTTFRDGQECLTTYSRDEYGNLVRWMENGLPKDSMLYDYDKRGNFVKRITLSPELDTVEFFVREITYQ